MPDLIDFQHQFIARLDARPGNVSPMSVYRNTALLGAVEALRDNYPVTCAVVGDRAFEALALGYSRQFPPCSPILADYGEDMPTWLDSQSIAGRLTYLSDVARCERMWVESMHAADASALDLEEAESWDHLAMLELRFKLHPSVRFSWHSTPAIAIWLAHQHEIKDEIVLDWRPHGALFTRPGLAVAGYEIDAPTHRLLCGVRLGETLGVALQAAATLYPNADVGSCFAGLVQRGAFAASMKERPEQ